MAQTFWPDLHVQQAGTQSAVTSITSSGKTLYTFAPFEANLLNVRDRRLAVRGHLAYTTAALEIPVIRLSLILDDGVNSQLSVASVASLAVGALNTDSPLRFNFNVSTDTPGSSAVFIGTGDIFITSLGATTPHNMPSSWITSAQFDASQPVTASLKIAASTSLTSANLVETFLSVR